MESACPATVRAETWMTPGSSSPAILYILGIMSKRPCEAVVGCGEGASGKGSVHSAGRAGLRLHFCYAHLPAEQVFAACSGDFIDLVGHRGTRG